MENFRLKMGTCECCGSSLVTAFSLGSSPYGDLFKQNSNAAKSLESYPLVVCHCRGCGSLALKDRYNVSKIRDIFIYESNITTGLDESFSEILKYLTSSRNASSALDIGSNDGTYLERAKEIGIKKVVGVEPALVPLESCRKKGIRAYQAFFDENIARLILSEHGRFDLVSMNYVFANMMGLEDVLGNCKLVLNDLGRITITTGYHPKQFASGMIDYIYHEHFNYFTITGLCKLADKCGLEVREVKEVRSKGGSICAVLERKGVDYKEIEPSVRVYMDREKEEGWFDEEKLAESARKYLMEINKLKDAIKAYKENGFKIVGFGASLSTAVLCSINGFGEVIDVLVDDNKRKHGLFSPQYGLEVGDIRELDQTGQYVVVILAWQHMNPIYERHKDSLCNARWFAPFAGELR